MTSVKLYPGETKAVMMHWADESPRLAQMPSLSPRFLGNDGVHRSVSVMRSWIGLLCVSCDSAPPSYWHVSPYTSWLAITSPSTSITNSSTPGLFAWQRFNEALWEDEERSAQYESQTVIQLRHCDTFQQEHCLLLFLKTLVWFHGAQKSRNFTTHLLSLFLSLPLVYERNRRA